MKFLVISNEFYPAIKPTSKMVYRILSLLSTKYNAKFDVISFSCDKKAIEVNDNIKNFHLINYSSKDKLSNFWSFIRIFYKIFRKIYSLFFHYHFFDTNRFYRRGIKFLKSEKYDGIIAFSGYFAEHNAAFKLSKKKNIPLYLFYADPFYYNVSFSSVKKSTLNRIENDWLKQARKCFLPHNYFEKYIEHYKEYNQKMVKCELPGFFDSYELSIIKKCVIDPKLIVYAGSFFYNWRRPDLFVKVALQLKEYTFLVLGKLDFEKFGIKEIPSNIKIVDRLDGNDYLKTIGSACALFLEDNSFPEQIPYKAFEYVSSRKKIIYSSKNELSSTSVFLSKYPNKFFIYNDFNDFNSLDKWLQNREGNYSDLNLNIYKEYTREYIVDILWKEILEV